MPTHRAHTFSLVWILPHGYRKSAVASPVKSLFVGLPTGMESIPALLRQVLAYVIVFMHEVCLYVCVSVCACLSGEMRSWRSSWKTLQGGCTSTPSLPVTLSLEVSSSTSATRWTLPSLDSSGKRVWSQQTFTLFAGRGCAWMAPALFPQRESYTFHGT